MTALRCRLCTCIGICDVFHCPIYRQQTIQFYFSVVPIADVTQYPIYALAQHPIQKYSAWRTEIQRQSLWQYRVLYYCLSCRLPRSATILRYCFSSSFVKLIPPMLSYPVHIPDTFQSYTNRTSCGVPFQQSNPPQAESNCSTNNHRQLSDTSNIIVL